LRRKEISTLQVKQIKKLMILFILDCFGTIFAERFAKQQDSTVLCPSLDYELTILRAADVNLPREAVVVGEGLSVRSGMSS